MKKGKLLILALLLLVSGILLGWVMMDRKQVNQDSNATSIDDADYVGVIEEIEPEKYIVKTDQGDTVHVSLDRQTKISVLQQSQQVKSDALQNGTKAAYWCQQPMLKISPPRCHAEKVIMMNMNQERSTPPLDKPTNPSENPSVPPVLQGKVIEMKGATLTVVEQEKKGFVTIHDETEIYLKTSKGLQPIDREQIEKGMTINVWYDGVMIMIYPMQVPADKVILEY